MKKDVIKKEDLYRKKKLLWSYVFFQDSLVTVQ